MQHQLAYVILLLPLAITGSNAQFDPSDYGLNCSSSDFLRVYLECLSAYNKANAIINCQLQCSNIDSAVDCINRIGYPNLSPQCLTSLSTIFTNLPQALKQLLFEVDVLNQCNINVQSVLDPCPNVHSFILPEWSAWGEYSDCVNDVNDRCKQFRNRECLTGISFRPPEPTAGCNGIISASRACANDACDTTTISLVADSTAMAQTATPVSNSGSRVFDGVWPITVLVFTFWYHVM